VVAQSHHFDDKQDQDPRQGSGRIWISIKEEGRIGIRIKMERRFWIRLRVMRIPNKMV
jgi:hypothetical protein